MTAHPEAAMTREQVLEEAAERAARLLLDAETICHAVSNRGGPTYRNMAEAFKQGRDQCKAALASTRQEPAPAAVRAYFSRYPSESDNRTKVAG